MLLLIGAVASLNSAALAWTAALLLGFAVARVLTQFSIAKARSAGFEMLWLCPNRNAEAIRTIEFALTAELRNRSSGLLILETISALAPPELEVQLDPAQAILPAHSALQVRLLVRPLRVGYRGIQGLSVLVRSDVAAFESQLTFANPFVIDVRPCALSYTETQRRGGLGRISAPANRTGLVSGQSMELRELREHQPGDALRKVAWKASARRGRLLVRDDEREHRHMLWFVLDASVELWAGHPGQAALDAAIDQLASMIRQSLRRGDRVGLCVIAARTLVRIAPNQGSHHERQLFEALAHATSTHDADRSGFDEQDAASAVLEHLRPMDPAGTRRVSSRDIDSIARLAQRALDRVRLATRCEPRGVSTRDRLLRRYIAVFGLPVPARTMADRDNSDRELIETLLWLASQRPDRVRICSPWPRSRLADSLVKVQRRMKKLRVALDWIPMNIHYGVPDTPPTPQQLVHHTLRWRQLADAVAGRHALRKLGIRDATVLRTARTGDLANS